MVTAEFEGINSFLVGMSDILLTSSVERLTRGQKCFELPEPVLIKIKNPTARLVTIPVRKWNLTLPYAESLWIASGRNDMALIGQYVKKLKDFSDDGAYMRAGYGPRIRSFNGIGDDYAKNKFEQRISTKEQVQKIDQLKFIEAVFAKNVKTRQAIISIGDPAKDEFDLSGNLKQTKDFPCTRSLQFIRNHQGKLDLVVHMRSNDFIWGASAVNIFNFTFMQEYMAAILNLEIGSYYHLVNNFHFYERHLGLVKQLAGVNNVSDKNSYCYNKKFKNLDDFDNGLRELSNYEEDLRKGNVVSPSFKDDFFADWANVLFHFYTKSGKFINPYLIQIAN